MVGGGVCTGRRPVRCLDRCAGVDELRILSTLLNAAADWHDSELPVEEAATAEQRAIHHVCISCALHRNIQHHQPTGRMNLRNAKANCGGCRAPGPALGAGKPALHVARDSSSEGAGGGVQGMRSVGERGIVEGEVCSVSGEVWCVVRVGRRVGMGWWDGRRSDRGVGR